MERVARGAAGIFGASGVALAAVAAHAGGLDARHAALLRAGVEMEMWHALALLGAAHLAPSSRRGRLAVGGFVAGTVLFAGGVDLAAFGLGAAARAAPFGGTVLIASWLLLAATAFRRDA
jgi:uncharacterized membrane protein YgdD (TMEM256/DUF423 family)